jgi:hypothetical protein
MSKVGDTHGNYGNNIRNNVYKEYDTKIREHMDGENTIKKNLIRNIIEDQVKVTNTLSA